MVTEADFMVYAGKTTCCGRYVAVHVDDGATDRKALARETAKWIRQGLVVEHRPYHAEVLPNFKRCCKYERGH